MKDIQETIKYEQLYSRLHELAVDGLIKPDSEEVRTFVLTAIYD